MADSLVAGSAFVKLKTMGNRQKTLAFIYKIWYTKVELVFFGENADTNGKISRKKQK